MTTIYSKLAKAKQNFKKIKKDTTGYGYKYAELEQVIEAIQQPLIDAGVDFLQQIDDDVIKTSLVDLESGEVISLVSMKIIATEAGKMSNIQAYGAGITSLRRYSLMTAFGLATEDDDGGKSDLKAPKKEETPTIQPIQINNTIINYNTSNLTNNIYNQEVKPKEDIQEVKPKVDNKDIYDFQFLYK